MHAHDVYVAAVKDVIAKMKSDVADLKASLTNSSRVTEIANTLTDRLMHLDALVMPVDPVEQPKVPAVPVKAEEPDEIFIGDEPEEPGEPKPHARHPSHAHTKHKKK